MAEADHLEGVWIDPNPPTLGGLRPFGSFIVPGSIRAIVDRREIGGKVAMIIEMHDHRPVVTSLTVHQRAGGPPVTGATLRSVPVDRLTREVLLAAARRTVASEGTKILARSAASGDAGALERLLARRAELGAWKLDDEHLAAVAHVYAEGEAFGTPVLHVAARFDVKRPTASRWCALARERFYLGAGPLGSPEECETCGLTTRAAHHLIDVPPLEGEDDASGGSITATYCPKHCPGNCDKEHDR